MPISQSELEQVCGVSFIYSRNLTYSATRSPILRSMHELCGSLNPQKFCKNILHVCVSMQEP